MDSRERLALLSKLSFPPLKCECQREIMMTSMTIWSMYPRTRHTNQPSRGHHRSQLAVVRGPIGAEARGGWRDVRSGKPRGSPRRQMGERPASSRLELDWADTAGRTRILDGEAMDLSHPPPRLRRVISGSFPLLIPLSLSPDDSVVWAGSLLLPVLGRGTPNSMVGAQHLKDWAGPELALWQSIVYRCW